MIDIFYFYIFFAFLAVCISAWNRRIGYIVFLIGSILSLLDILSMQMLNTHITLLVLTGFDLTMLQMAPKVVPKYFWGGLIFLAVHFLLPPFLYKFLNKIVDRFENCRNICIIFVLTLALMVGGLFYYPATVIAYKQIIVNSYNLCKYQNVSTEELFQKLGSKKRYLINEQIKAEPGKNIVVIYCESLDANFLDQELFPLEMSKLNELKKGSMFFYSNYKCVFGSGWTIAALYSTQTGLPCLFGANRGGLGGNSALTNIHTVDAVSYTSVLKKAGYKNVFLSNSSLKFAGTGNLMSLFGYECKGWKTFGNKISRTKWGVHDYDLFEAAKKEYKKLSQDKKPFNLTLLTIDTHYPKGVPDPRLKSKINKKINPNSHEYTIASLDYLLNDFIRFIKSCDNGKETVIVILGDHLMIGNKKVTPVVKKLEIKPRRILLMSNRQSEQFRLEDEIGFYDLPKMILELAEVKTNALFLKDLDIKVNPKFIQEYQDIFTILNMRFCK